MFNNGLYNIARSHYKTNILKDHDTEYWLGRLIDTFEVAIRAGVSEEVLDEAREFHSQAHILWEWWTAGNSGGFHNPDQARESLTRSVEYSKMRIEVLENALK